MDAVTTRLPSGLNAALFTSSVCPESVASAAPVWASHSRAVLSYDAVTTRVPSGLNAALITRSRMPEVWQAQRRSWRPTAARCCPRTR